MRARLRHWVARWLQRQPRDRLLGLLEDIAPGIGIDSVLLPGRNGEVLAPLSDPVISRAYLYAGSWSEELVALLTSALTRGGTLIDIGANIGLTTVPLARLDGVRVIAVEPHPGNLQHLRASLGWNDLNDRVTVLPIALADEEGSMALEVSASNIGDHRLRREGVPSSPGLFDEEERQVLTVPVRRLDDVVDLDSLARPLVVKVDVQGGEGLVLRGGPDVIAAADLLVLEFWPYALRRLGCDPLLLLDDLASAFTEFAVLDTLSGSPVTFQPLGPDGSALISAASGAVSDDDVAHWDIVLRGSPRP